MAYRSKSSTPRKKTAAYSQQSFRLSDFSFFGLFIKILAMCLIFFSIFGNFSFGSFRSSVDFDKSSVDNNLYVERNGVIDYAYIDGSPAFSRFVTRLENFVGLFKGPTEFAGDLVSAFFSLFGSENYAVVFCNAGSNANPDILYVALVRIASVDSGAFKTIYHFSTCYSSYASSVYSTYVGVHPARFVQLWKVLDTAYYIEFDDYDSIRTYTDILTYSNYDDALTQFNLFYDHRRE